MTPPGDGGHPRRMLDAFLKGIDQKRDLESTPKSRVRYAQGRRKPPTIFGTNSLWFAPVRK
jgi:hypothetical protein